MGKVRDREYGEMYAAYLKVEDKYWEWAALYKEFQRKKPLVIIILSLKKVKNLIG